MLLTLLNKVRRTKPQLRIRRAEAFIALLHARWYVRCLASLVTAGEVTIKDFEEQCAESIGVDCCQWVALDNIPATLDDFRGCIASCIGDKTSVGLIID